MNHLNLDPTGVGRDPACLRVAGDRTATDGAAKGRIASRGPRGYSGQMSAALPCRSMIAALISL
ncbi:MAG: hypothetical protein ACJ78M_12030, partial [Gemmatimonadaceae bacterium]